MDRTEKRYILFSWLCTHVSFASKAAGFIWKYNFCVFTLNTILRSTFFWCRSLVDSMSDALSFSIFSSFSQLLSFPVSTWLLVFASLIVVCFAHFLITSIVLMCKSYNGIKQFCGPPTHWLKGHVNRVSTVHSIVAYNKNLFLMNWDPARKRTKMPKMIVRLL